MVAGGVAGPADPDHRERPVLLWWFYPEQPPADTALALPEEPSIAVLPFRNLSDDAEQEFFVDGLTEDLITDLAKLSGLFVISRNSVFTYKGQATKAPQVARELGVRYVLEGSVRRAADTIRVTAQLIDAQSDRPLWAESYDRQLDDVFAVQDALKQQIVAALTVELSPGEQAQLANRPTENLEAYEYYLRGRQAMYLLTLRSIRTAYWALEKAIELDPNFAEAYATLALASALDYRGIDQWNDWVRPPGRARAQAIQQARKALALNPDLALPELALAYVQSSRSQIRRGACSGRAGDRTGAERFLGVSNPGAGLDRRRTPRGSASGDGASPASRPEAARALLQHARENPVRAEGLCQRSRKSGEGGRAK